MEGMSKSCERRRLPGPVSINRIGIRRTSLIPDEIAYVGTV